MNWWTRNWHVVAFLLLVAGLLVAFNLLANAGQIKVTP